jgi:hypothetical protein
VTPACKGSAIDPNEIGYDSIGYVWQPALDIVKDEAEIAGDTADVLVQRVSNHMPDTLEPDEQLIANVEISRCPVTIDELTYLQQGVQQQHDLVLVEVVGLEVGAQTDQPLTQLMPARVPVIAHLWSALKMLDGFNESALEISQIAIGSL